MPALGVGRLVCRAQLLRVGSAGLVCRLPRLAHIPLCRLQLRHPAPQLRQQRAVVDKLWRLGQLLRLPDELEGKVCEGDVAAGRSAAALLLVVRRQRLRGAQGRKRGGVMGCPISTRSKQGARSPQQPGSRACSCPH